MPNLSLGLMASQALHSSTSGPMPGRGHESMQVQISETGIARLGTLPMGPNYALKLGWWQQG